MPLARITDFMAAGRLGPVLAMFCCLLLPAGPAEGLTLNETDYVDLREVAARLGMKTAWQEKGEILLLTSKWTRMRFELHQRFMELNGCRVLMGYPVAAHGGRLHISESDYTHVIQPVLTPQVFGKPPPVRHIMLDPGHGGSDPGAENPALGLREKALTLDLAKRLQSLLEAQGFIVTLTRDRDAFIPLETRAAMANRSGADLFISLHFNSLGKKDVSGVETYAFTPLMQPSSSRQKLHSSDRRRYAGNAHDPWNALLGFYVQRHLADALPVPDRGLKRARFAVLRELDIPGILIEGGFLSHPIEGRNAGSAAYRGQIAGAITQGVLLYRQTVDRLRGAGG